ncbi:MAG TPA: hypothetical protein PLG43_03610 [Spirochaetia bacterium]|nr:hypothetical protein [Spirochaetia bacterium]
MGKKKLIFLLEGDSVLQALLTLYLFTAGFDVKPLESFTQVSESSGEADAVICDEDDIPADADFPPAEGRSASTRFIVLSSFSLISRDDQPNVHTLDKPFSLAVLRDIIDQKSN